MGTALSGKNGTLKISTTAVALVSKWELEIAYNLDSRATNESSGAKATCAGTYIGNWTVEGLLDTAAAMTILAGTAATLLFYVDATRLYTVPSIVERFRKIVDIDDGKFISFTASGRSNGAITQPTWA